MNEEAKQVPIDKPVTSADQGLALARRLYEFLDSKKTGSLRLMHITPVNSYFGYFLLGTATSEVHLSSLLKEIRREFADDMSTGKSGGPRPDDGESGWAVVDFIDVVVHLFVDEQRRFYNLERLWGDAEVLMSSEP